MRRLTRHIPHPRPRQRGFTYLLMLFALAAGAAGLAALGERASTAVQRERERELMFRGNAIVDAIESYRLATPGDAKQLPQTLEELVEDRRGPRALRHLRRIYADPFTGRPDWVLLASEDGRLAGVRSRSEALAMRSLDLPELPVGRPARISDRLFLPITERAASAVQVSPAVPKSVSITPLVPP